MTTRAPLAAVALSLAMVGLTGLIAVEWQYTGGPAWNPVSPPAHETRARVDKAPADTSLSRIRQRVAIVLGRPLFNPDRRPDPSAQNDNGLDRLSGVLVTPSGKMAIFAPRSGGKPVVVAPGGHIGDLVVTTIGDDTITVTGPDGPRVLRPSFAPPDAKAPPNRSPLKLMPTAEK
jgi:hypothetical protein